MFVKFGDKTKPMIVKKSKDLDGYCSEEQDNALFLDDSENLKAKILKDQLKDNTKK